MVKIALIIKKEKVIVILPTKLKTQVQKTSLNFQLTV
jgi:hypothetical protein